MPGGQGSSIYHVTITEGTRQSPRWDVVVTPQAAYIDTVQGERAIQQRRQSQECNSWVLGHLRSHPRGRTVRQIDAQQASHGDVETPPSARLDHWLNTTPPVAGLSRSTAGRPGFSSEAPEMSVKNGPLHVGRTATHRIRVHRALFKALSTGNMWQQGGARTMPSPTGTASCVRSPIHCHGDTIQTISGRK